MDKFTTLSVSVTEEIKASKVLTFIRTQIKLSHLLITDKSYFYFRFLPKVLKYEIVLFQDLENVYKSGIFSLSKLSKNEDQITLLITPEFFALFEVDNLLVVKKIVDTSLEDIRSYIEQTYKIHPSKVIEVDQKRLAELQEKKSKGSQKRVLKSLHKFTQDKSFQYFLLYCIVVILLFIIYLHDTNLLQTTQEIQPSMKQQSFFSQKEILYKKHSNKNLSKTLIKFLDLIAKLNIELKAIEYQGGGLEIKLLSSSKKELLKVLEFSNLNIGLQSIKQESSLENYSMEIILHG